MLRLPSGALLADDFADHVLHAEMKKDVTSTAAWDVLILVPKYHRRSPEIVDDDARFVWKLLNEGAEDAKTA